MGLGLGLGLDTIGQTSPGAGLGLLGCWNLASFTHQHITNTPHTTYNNIYIIIHIIFIMIIIYIYISFMLYNIYIL